MAGTPSVLRLKITLEEVEPSIWRRIEIRADASFWDLHVAIQDAMGWLDCHLHQFDVTDPSGTEHRIGIPDDSGWGEPTEPGWERKLSAMFRRPDDAAVYTYDFGDGWEHSVVLEALDPAQPRTAYPQCLAGGRRCPPEDCGGPWGYGHLLEVLADEEHEEHAEMLEWCGGRIDADAFDPKAVVFTDPEERLQYVGRP